MTALARITPPPTHTPVDTPKPPPTATATWPRTPTPATAAPGLAATATPTTPPDVSGISGIVLIGPQCPVMREGEECPDRPYEAIIGIRDGTGQAVAGTTSGADGRFRVVLPPGTYTLVARPPTSTVFPAPVEMSVTVSTEGFTDVVVSMDSGIR